MLGAMAKVMGFMELEDVNQICGDTLGKKYPDALQGNLEGIRRGYEEIKELTGSVCQSLQRARQKKLPAGKRLRGGGMPQPLKAALIQGLGVP